MKSQDIIQDVIGALNLLIVGITGLIVWLYTKAAQRSNEIQEQPLLNFYFKKSANNAGGAELGNISIKNVGKGPAYNISIEPIFLQGYKYHFYLENPMIESIEEKELQVTVRTPTGGAEGSNRDLMWFLHRLIPQKLTPETLNQAMNNPGIFLAHYQGPNGKTYYSVFALYDTLPPIGDIVMQFVIHGSGTFSVEQGKEIWLKEKKVRSPFEE